MDRWLNLPPLLAFVAALFLATPLAAKPSAAPVSGQPAEVPIEAFIQQAQSITDAVLEHHPDPPTRQEMWLAGAKALLARVGVTQYSGLSNRVSRLNTEQQFSEFAKEILSSEAVRKNSQPAWVLQATFLYGILGVVPGGAYLETAKEAFVGGQLKANRYVGTGIALGYDKAADYPQIGSMFPHGPMERAGGRAGDLILKVDDHDVHGTKVRDVVELLRGDEGTRVTLIVRAPADTETRTIVVTRGAVVLETLQGLRQTAAGQWEYLVEPGSPIHYVKIDKINGSTAHDLKRLERHLRAEGCHAVVLDLRGDDSYDLHYALLVADVLLDEGVIGRLRMGDRVREFRSDRDHLFRDWPLAVLVDRSTSGGAEWIAAALQDNRAAVIVGETTSGFVDIRTPVALPGSDTILHLATAIFERPSGRPMRGPKDVYTFRVFESRPDVFWGVRPDCIVHPHEKGSAARAVAQQRREATPAQAATDQAPDVFLAAAIEELKTQLETGQGRTPHNGAPSAPEKESD